MPTPNSRTIHIALKSLLIALPIGILAHDVSEIKPTAFFLAPILIACVVCISLLWLSKKLSSRDEPAIPSMADGVENGLKACPFCGEEIKLIAVSCRFCGRMLKPCAMDTVLIISVIFTLLLACFHAAAALHDPGIGGRE